MGTILSSRIKDNKEVIVEVSLDYNEVVQLKGHMDNVHLFSENVSETELDVSRRGQRDATIYFIVPRELRKGLEDKKKVKCQRLDTKSKTIFVYVVDKIGL